MSYLDWLLRLGFGVMFVVSAVAKVRSRASFAEFRETVRQWSALPAPVDAALAAAVVCAEIAVPVLLTLPPSASAGYLAAAVLLAAFDVAILTARRRGLSRPCHCFGAAGKPPSNRHIAVNLALCVVALTGFFGRVFPSWRGSWNLEGSMPYLVGGFAVLAVLVVFNLVLTFGMVKRMREHAEHFNRLSGGGHRTAGLAVGATVPEFATVTTDDEPVTSSDLAGTVAVAFFSPGCHACAEQLPKFLDYAKALPSDAAKPLAVVIGGPDETGAEVELLRGLSRVVVEPFNGPVASAFGVDAYPTLYLVADGSVVNSGNAVDALPVPALT